MGLCYASHSDRESWLADRKRGIGASEAAAIYGVSKWSNPVRLWEEKCGLRKPKDLGGVSYVEQGARAEGPIRELFGILHPEYEVTSRPFDMLYQEERPWLYATLDGELTEKETGERGILEIKKHEIQSRRDWQEWDGQVPIYYYTQICHQLLATGFSFAWLYAALISWNGEVRLRPYFFLRDGCLDDMELLLKEETEFWGCVQTRRRPATKLTL